MNDNPASLARSVLQVPPSRIRALADIAMSMEGVLKLYFGESTLPTPAFIRSAAAHAVEDGFTYYTENAGLPPLRRAIAEKYRELHEVELDPARHVVVTASGVQALHNAMRCILDPGDEAVILTPAWPNGSAIAGLCSARAVQVPHLLRGDRYGIDFEAVESAVGGRTRMILYTSPSNPLGWVATRDDQEMLLDLCRRRGLWLVADEVYERLWYEGPVAPSLLRLSSRDDRVVVVQSFSKSYCMTGWRLGWLVSNVELASKAAQLNEFIVSHAASMTQKAGEAALREGEAEVHRLVEMLRANRDFVLTALRDMRGITLPRPEGAFYVFPRIEGLEDSFEFCKRLLLEQKVGIAPGSAFGSGGEGSVRICYAAGRSVLEPALERFRYFVCGRA